MKSDIRESFCSHCCVPLGVPSETQFFKLKKGGWKMPLSSQAKAERKSTCSTHRTIRTSTRSKGNEARSPNEPNPGELLL